MKNGFGNNNCVMKKDDVILAHNNVKDADTEIVKDVVDENDNGPTDCLLFEQVYRNFNILRSYKDENVII